MKTFTIIENGVAGGGSAEMAGAAAQRRRHLIERSRKWWRRTARRPSAGKRRNAINVPIVAWNQSSNQCLKYCEKRPQLWLSGVSAENEKLARRRWHGVRKPSAQIQKVISVASSAKKAWRRKRSYRSIIIMWLSIICKYCVNVISSLRLWRIIVASMTNQWKRHLKYQ